MVDDRRTNDRANLGSGRGDGEGSSVIFGIDGNRIGEAGRSTDVFAGTREGETGKSGRKFFAGREIRTGISQRFGRGKGPGGWGGGEEGKGAVIREWGELRDGTGRSRRCRAVRGRRGWRW